MKNQQELTNLAQAILEQLPNGVVVTDLEGKIIYVNRATESLTKYSRSELIGENPRIFNAHEHAEEIQQDIMNHMVQGRIWHGEIPQKSLGSANYLAEFDIFPVYDPSNEPLALVSIQEDVTKHKFFEEREKKRQHMLTLLYETISNCLDSSFGYIDYDFIAKQLKELTEATGIVISLYHPEKKCLITKAVAGSKYALATSFNILGSNIIGKEWHFSEERINILQSGQIRRIENLNQFIAPELKENAIADIVKKLNIGAIYQAGLVSKNELLGAAIIFMPMTKEIQEPNIIEIFIKEISSFVLRSRLERKLVETKNKYRSLIDNTLDGVFVTDPDGNYIDVNPAACKMLGYTRDELIKLCITDIVPKEWTALSDEAFKQLREQGCIYFEGLLLKKNEDQFPAQIHATVLPDGNYLATVRDVTESKKAEEKLILTIQELMSIRNVMIDREKLSIIGQMAAGMAHEIKNPLTSVRGFAQLLKEKHKEDKDLNSYLELMIAEVDQASRVITDFLQLARPKPPALIPISLKPLLEDTIRIIEPQTFMKNIRLITSFDKELPDCLVDPPQIKQVLLNLYQNALEAMPQGGSLSITCQWASDQEEIIIGIKDTGCGIPMRALNNIGVPFYTTKEQGTGLGLSICYAIIDAHKGRIEIQSKEGEGTLFKVILPGLLPPRQ